jgi:sugar phosphate isomerase/epimerase
MKRNSISRRKFVGSAAAAAAFSIIPFNHSYSIGTQSRKPDSKIGGIQLGVTTYSYLSMPHSAEEVLGYLLQAGVSSIELRSVAEESLGLPQGPARQTRPSGVELSQQEKDERARVAAETREAQRKWRLSLPMKKYADMRKMYNDAGVKIHIAKFAPATWSDEEIDYAFTAAKVLGAYGVSDEIGEDACQRLGKFAEKHKSLAIFHQHGQNAQPGWTFDKFLAYSPAVMLNFDAGHYYGATGLHPNDIIEKYHTRISSIHIKDLTGPKSNPPNAYAVFGKGETPINDILLFLKKKKWPINVDLELETRSIPQGSDAAREVTRCIEYMKNILA